MASGRAFEVRHPEMIKVGKANLIVLSSAGELTKIPDESESVALMSPGSSSCRELRSANSELSIEYLRYSYSLKQKRPFSFDNL